MNTSTNDAHQGMGGFLGWVERSGNKLPDPVFLFFWLIVGLVAISVLASLSGVSAAASHEDRPRDRYAASDHRNQLIVSRQYREVVGGYAQDLYPFPSTGLRTGCYVGCRGR